jgi:hypothetical protein
MALVLKNKAVFLHIPKTGGNWVRKVLEELDLIDREVAHKHADIDHYFAPFYQNKKSKTVITKYIFREVFSPFIKKPFMFCFVRNPLSWYESWFRYASQPRIKGLRFGRKKDIIGWHPNAMLNGLVTSDFNQFIRNIIDSRPGYVTELYGWYTRPQMDFIGKQENLADDLVKVLKIMNIKFDEEFIRNYKKVGVSDKKEIVWQKELEKEAALCEYSGMLRYGYNSTLVDLGLKEK